MSAGRSIGRGKTRKKPRKLVLIFGESENDTKAIEAFLRGLWPDATWSIEARKRPPILLKDAKASDVPSRVARIAAIIRAAQTEADVIAVFAHEDCDAVEPAHIALEAKIRSALEGDGYMAEGAAPAWEMETWLMQWPDAFPLHISSWRSVDNYKGRNLGLIANAKEELTRALRSRPGVRDYRESDAPMLASIVVREGWVRAPLASSDSFNRFVIAADRVAAAQQTA